MTDATKASILLGTLAAGLLVLLGAVLQQSHKASANAARAQAAEVRAQQQTGRADAALEAEAKAKAAEATAQQVVAQREADVARLQAALAQHPLPMPAQPVPADATVAVVADGLQGLGLHPQLLGGAYPLGMTLPDSRTTLTWGREAQRIPALAARLETLDALARAQEGATGALHQQLDATQDARTAADTRADAQQHRAEALQEALNLQPQERPWSAGLLVGLDTTGTRRLGAYVSRSWGPVQAQVVVLGNTAAIGGGFRF